MGSTVAAIKIAPSALLVMLLLGCPHSQETIQSDVPEERPSAAVRRAEESFNPSDYDRVARAPQRDSTARDTVPGDTLAGNPAPTALEQTAGYRVQLISTTSIDEANAKRLLAESLFPTEWFYLQYDPPTYKIRAGNFLVRLEADRFRAQAAGKGFPGAWVVPERVFKNPPPPPTHNNSPTSK